MQKPRWMTDVLLRLLRACRDCNPDMKDLFFSSYFMYMRMYVCLCVSMEEIYRHNFVVVACGSYFTRSPRVYMVFEMRAPHRLRALSGILFSLSLVAEKGVRMIISGRFTSLSHDLYRPFYLLPRNF